MRHAAGGVACILLLQGSGAGAGGMVLAFFFVPSDASPEGGKGPRRRAERSLGPLGFILHLAFMDCICVFHL